MSKIKSEHKQEEFIKEKDKEKVLMPHTILVYDSETDS